MNDNLLKRSAVAFWMAMKNFWTTKGFLPRLIGKETLQEGQHTYLILEHSMKNGNEQEQEQEGLWIQIETGG